jgi:sugar (glycoside-pentoside-hexuronide) transporter
MNDQRSRLSPLVKASYGSGEFFNATSTVIILMLYLKFLTDVVGLSPFWAGICVVAGKLWDAISDPIIGHLSDKTRTRWGRRRVYFLVFAVPGSLAFASMWIHLELASTWATVVYYALAYITFKTVSSLLNVPYQALGPELATDYDERTSLIIYRMSFSLVGAILAGVVPNLIVRRYQDAGAPELGHLVVAAVFGAIYVAIWLWVFSVVREREAIETRRSTPFLRSLRLTLRNRSFRILIGLYLCSFLALDTLTASTKYFIDEYIGNPSLMAAVMGTMLTCALLSLPGYLWLIRRFDRRVSYILGTSIWAASLVGLLMVPTGASGAVVVAILVPTGIGMASAFVVPWSALPEVIDVDQAVNGRTDEGVYAGIMTFLRKATTTLAIFLIATSLELTGYVPPDQLGEAAQPGQVLWSIRLFTTVLPTVLLVIGALLAMRYPITKAGHAMMRRFIDRPLGEEPTAEERVDLGRFLERSYGAGAEPTETTKKPTAVARHRPR